MKARSREVNIFNMSLLDILCGALGAICFMMISLLPYYRPPGQDFSITQDQKKLLDSVQDIKDLAERLKNVRSAEDLSGLVKQLQEKILQLDNEIKSLQGTVNSLLAEKDALKKQIEALEKENEELNFQMLEKEVERQKLAKENEKLQQELEMQNLWTVSLTAANSTQSIDCSLVEMRATTPSGKKQPPFDVATRSHARFWPGDLFLRTGSTCIHIAQFRPKGSESKLYANLLHEPPRQQRTEVSGIVVGSGFPNIDIPPVVLSPDRPWMLVGTFRIGDDHVPKFTAATAEERDAEWKHLMGSDVPQSVEPGTPSKGRTSSNTGRVDMAAIGRLRALGDALRAAKTDEEKQLLFDKALREATNEAERDRIKSMMSAFLRSKQPGASESKKQ